MLKRGPNQSWNEFQEDLRDARDEALNRYRTAKKKADEAFVEVEKIEKQLKESHAGEPMLIALSGITCSREP